MLFMGVQTLLGIDASAALQIITELIETGMLPAVLEPVRGLLITLIENDLIDMAVAL